MCEPLKVGFCAKKLHHLQELKPFERSCQYFKITIWLCVEKHFRQVRGVFTSSMSALLHSSTKWSAYLARSGNADYKISAETGFLCAKCAARAPVLRSEIKYTFCASFWNSVSVSQNSEILVYYFYIFKEFNILWMLLLDSVVKNMLILKKIGIIFRFCPTACVLRC
jgi:hypothetical protein